MDLTNLTNLTNLAINEINSQLYLTLSTVNCDGQPWAAPVYFAFDTQYNCYWVSEFTSQHSINLRANNRVMAVIFNSTVSHGQGFGVYIQGIVTEFGEVDTEEIKMGIELLSSRINSNYKPEPERFLSPLPRRIYKLTVQKIWVNTVIDLNGQKVDRRIDLTDKFIS